MNAPQSTITAAPSFTHGMHSAARTYFRNRWTLVALAGLVVCIGLYFGGWGWLVAVGAAPIILSTLPCLIMCGFGVCMMCRSNKSSGTMPGGASDATPSASAVGTAAIGAQPLEYSGCHDDTGLTNAEDRPADSSANSAIDNIVKPDAEHLSAEPPNEQMA